MTAGRKVLIFVGGGFALLVILAFLAGFLLPLLAKASKGMQAAACLQNLSQLGLAARMHAVNHDSQFPDDWLQSTNASEFTVPRLLICPADKHHSLAAAWGVVGASNITYVYLGKGGNDDQTNRVLAICPIHGHVLLGNGKVLFAWAQRHPEALIERDGATFVDPDQMTPMRRKSGPRTTKP